MAKGSGKVGERVTQVKASADPLFVSSALADRSSLVVEAAAQRLTAWLKADQLEISLFTLAGALESAYRRLHEGGSVADPGCWGRLALLEAVAALHGRGRAGAAEAEAVARLAIKTVQIEVVSFGPQDSGKGLRASAALLLSNLRPPGALLELGLLLFDDAPNEAREGSRHKAPCRQAAATAIGQLGDPAGAVLLAVRLQQSQGEEPEVLAEAMDALVALAEPRTVELLTPWLSVTDPYLVATAATGIAAVGRAAAVPLLLAALEGAMREAKEPLVYALGSVRADEGREAL
ncbi:MAG TPA: HEAT repeat domain-containing protein, partial [Symbiobacteriaceae bacterium]|nr:HEAT repeat domain-containing protein [Symbiobacteriaceae bacterium]